MKKPGLANLITLSRFAFIFLAALCIVSYSPEKDYYRWLTILLVLGAIASDILDGKVARWLRQESNIGRVLDAVADALGFTLAFIFLYFFSLGQRFPVWFVLLVVGRELLVYGLFLAVLVRNGRIDKKPSSLARLNTLLLALSILALLLWVPYAWALWVVAAISTIYTGADNILAAVAALKKS